MLKSDGTRNMTEGNPRRLIVSFAVPIFVSQLFQQLYNIGDSVIVGKCLGKDELAAVSSSGTLIFLIVSLFSGIAMGSGVVISRYFGAGNHESMSRAIHTNVAFGIVTGVFLTVFGVAASPTLLRWMGTDESVMPNSVIYFRCYFLGAMGIVMYNTLNGIMTAMGDSKRPLYYLIFSSVLNIALDLLFIKVFGLGVGSAAVATSVSQTASALLCMLHLTKKGTIYQIKLKSLRFHGDMLKEILRFGLPTGVQNSVIGFANVIVQSNINSFGADAMAGYGSYIKVEGFAFLPVTCFSMAMSTFVSQNLGAGRKDRAKKGANFGVIASISIAELIGVIIFAGAPLLLLMFTDDPGVIEFGVKQARLEALFYFLLAFSHCVAGICRGAGKAVFPMIVMLSVWCVFRISYISAAMHWRHEIELIYMAYPITWSISSLIFFIYNISSKWLKGRTAPLS